MAETMAEVGMPRAVAIMTLVFDRQIDEANDAIENDPDHEELAAALVTLLNGSHARVCAVEQVDSATRWAEFALRLAAADEWHG